MHATISKEFAFDAAHRLDRLPESHKCHRLHGHTYRVEVVIAGDVGDDGFVLDYQVLSDWWALMFAELDHHYLNEVPGLEIPSTEHLAAWILRRFCVSASRHDHFRTRSLSVMHVIVHESSTTWCKVHPVDLNR